MITKITKPTAAEVSEAELRRADEQGLVRPTAIAYPRLDNLSNNSNTLAAAAESYLADCEMRMLSPNTLALNRIVLKYLTAYLLTENVRAVTADNLRQFIVEKAKLTSTATAARYFDVLRPFFRFALNEGFLDTSPVTNLKRPKVSVKPIEPLSPIEINALLAACSGDEFVTTRDKLVVVLLYDSGLRASELTALQIADVDLSAQTVLVRQSKTGWPRIVPFGKSTKSLLLKYISVRPSANCNHLIVVQGGQGTDRYRIRAIMSKLGKRAGIRVHPHLLRHSCAVGLLRNGANVFELQKVLGHSTLEMSRRYSQIADTDLLVRYETASPVDNLKRASFLEAE